MSTKPAPSPVVAVLNMKGGVGKTTISGNLFRELYRRISPNKTLLVDFDAQFNLSQLVLSERRYDELQKNKRTIWHVLEPDTPASVFSISESELKKIHSVFDYTVRLKNTTRDEHELFLIPGDFRIASLNLRENSQSLEFPRKRFANLIAKAREQCALTVLDCNPSSSFLTRCAIENSTHILVPVRPDKYSVLGLKMLDEYINQLPSLLRKPELLIIMNGVKADQSSVEAEIRGHSVYGSKVLVTRINETKVLAARADYTGFGADRGVKNSKVTRRLLGVASDELVDKLKLT